jgi:hypothetical protein
MTQQWPHGDGGFQQQPPNYAPPRSQRGDPSTPKPSSETLWKVSRIVALSGLAIAVVGLLLGRNVLMLGVLGAVIGGVLMAVALIGRASRPPANAGSQPIAHTPDGQPVYQVVGYTPDGSPVTADRAVGYQPVNQHTNTLAVVTLVLSLFFSVLAIPFGHVALSQINRTGEQGRGLALAGLIIGYIGLGALIILGAVVAVNS